MQPRLEEDMPEGSENQATITCCHHWQIEPAGGPVSSGVCQLCGIEREFKNSLDISTWGDGPRNAALMRSRKRYLVEHNEILRMLREKTVDFKEGDEE